VIAVVLVALALAVLAIVLVLLVLIGAHREAPWTALGADPPTPLAGFARAVLGVYVRKSSHDHDAKPVEITALAKGRR
jgi:hypothetical protein